MFALGQQQLLHASYFLLEAVILASSHYCNCALIGQLQAMEISGRSTNIWTSVLYHPDRLIGHFSIQICLAFFYNSIRLDTPGRAVISYSSFSLKQFRAITYLCFLQPILLKVVGTPSANLKILQTAIMFFLALDFLFSCLTQVSSILNYFQRSYLNTRYFIATHGLLVFIENQWVRLKIPLVLRLFFMCRLCWDVLILSYREIPSTPIIKNKPVTDVCNPADWYYYYNSRDSGIMWKCRKSMPSTVVATNKVQNEVEWMAQQLVVGSCDTLLGVLGITSALSYLAHHVGVLFTLYLGTHAEEDQSMGTVTAILFFILALQTGLTGMATSQRMLRLYKNFCLVFSAILHFLHSMVHPQLMSMSTSHTHTIVQHSRPLILCTFLVIFPTWFVYYLWTMHEMSTWLLAVTAFSIEVTIKVIITLLVYSLFIIDAYRDTFWEGLDDYVYYIKAIGSSIEFLFGLFLFCNGGWIFLFESRGAIRAFMMCIHAYFNIWVQAKEGWKIFMNRRTAVKKINSLPEATTDQLTNHNDVCAICYQELRQARVTNCNHFFHGVCLRKWLYIQDKCPLCHQMIYKVDEESPVDEQTDNDINNGGPHVH